MNYDEILKKLEQEEQELQFTVFTNETALKIGLLLAERAKKESKSIAIDINRSGHQLFHYSCEGSSPDNDQWILRKSRVVNRFQHCSYYIAVELAKSGCTMEDRYHINSFDYAASGGSFPIIIKNVGVVGTITVSGMPEEVDHDWVVTAIREIQKVGF